MKENPSYLITLLLATFPTGWIGIHKIYMGQNYIGVAYLLFCWTTIPIIKSYIDVFLLLRMGEEGFIDKHHDDDSKEEYYLKKLAEENPEAVDREVLNELEKDDEEDTDSQEKEESNKNIKSKDSEDNEDEEDYIEEPDYSDYYGNW